MFDTNALKATAAVVCTNISFSTNLIQFCCLDDREVQVDFTAICHHQMFLRFAGFFDFESSIFLDWLTTNETQFLLYFLRYCKEVLAYPRQFERACNTIVAASGSDGQPPLLLSAINLFERLNISLSLLKQNIPFNVDPLLQKLSFLQAKLSVFLLDAAV